MFKPSTSNSSPFCFLFMTWRTHAQLFLCRGRDYTSIIHAERIIIIVSSYFVVWAFTSINFMIALAEAMWFNVLIAMMVTSTETKMITLLFGKFEMITVMNTIIIFVFVIVSMLETVTTSTFTLMTKASTITTK